MLKNSISFSFPVMRFLGFLFLLLLLSCNPKPAPRGVSGILDLRAHSFDAIIRLDGEWEFYWEELLSPSDFINLEGEEISERKESKSIFTKVPSDWKGVNWFGKKLPGHGYATYRMKILLGEIPNEKLAFSIKDQAHAYNFFLNGSLVVQSGKVGTSFETMVPHLNEVTYEFTPDKPELDLYFKFQTFCIELGAYVSPLNLEKQNKLT